MTSVDEIWSVRPDWERADFEIRLTFPDLNSAISGKVINFGRGGIFVSTDAKIPNPGDKAHFVIQFDQGAPALVEGEGEVRWIRPIATVENPRGFGVEFTYLNDQARGHVIAMVKDLKSKAFIPKR